MKIKNISINFYSRVGLFGFGSGLSCNEILGPELHIAFFQSQVKVVNTDGTGSALLKRFRPKRLHIVIKRPFLEGLFCAPLPSKDCKREPVLVACTQASPDEVAALKPSDSSLTLYSGCSKHIVHLKKQKCIVVLLVLQTCLLLNQSRRRASTSRRFTILFACPYSWNVCVIVFIGPFAFYFGVS